MEKLSINKVKLKSLKNAPLGKIGIKFINTEVEGNMIEIRAIPENMDIFAKESVFVKLDVSKSDITAMIELYGGGS